jgi:hypothetical protein
VKTVLLLLLCSCVVNAPVANRCYYDANCKDNKVCEYGECVVPTLNPAGQGCGVIDTPCNCNGTIAYNGLVTNTTLCQSGRHQFSRCIGDCWEAKCYCN